MKYFPEFILSVNLLLNHLVSAVIYDPVELKTAAEVIRVINTIQNCHLHLAGDQIDLEPVINNPITIVPVRSNKRGFHSIKTKGINCIFVINFFPKTTDDNQLINKVRYALRETKDVLIYHPSYSIDYSILGAVGRYYLFITTLSGVKLVKVLKSIFQQEQYTRPPWYPCFGAQ